MFTVPGQYREDPRRRDGEKIQGVPWIKSDPDPEVDGEKMRSRELSEAEKEAIAERRAEQEDLAGAPKRFAITVKDIQEDGATVGRAGCKSALVGGKFRLPHTAPCRARFEEALKGDKKVYPRSGRTSSRQRLSRPTQPGEKPGKRQGRKKTTTIPNLQP